MSPYSGCLIDLACHKRHLLGFLHGLLGTLKFRSMSHGARQARNENEASQRIRNLKNNTVAPNSSKKALLLYILGLKASISITSILGAQGQRKAKCCQNVQTQLPSVDPKRSEHHILYSPQLLAPSCSAFKVQASGFGVPGK